MLKAIDAAGVGVLAEDACRGEAYTCPECGEALILKQGPIVVAHFAHRPPVTCPYSVGESGRHLAMKRQVGRLFTKLLVDYEVKLLPDRRADVLVARRIVVECQVSPLSADEWTARTEAYNRAGHPVLWVWDLCRIGWGRERPALFDDLGQREVRVPVEMLLCHRKSYGRLYVMDLANELRAVHLQPAAPRLRYFATDPDDTYRPRRLRLPLTHPIGRCLRAFSGPSGERLVELGEGVWWKDVASGDAA